MVSHTSWWFCFVFSWLFFSLGSLYWTFSININKNQVILIFNYEVSPYFNFIISTFALILFIWWMLSYLPLLQKYGFFQFLEYVYSKCFDISVCDSDTWVFSNAVSIDSFSLYGLMIPPGFHESFLYFYENLSVSEVKIFDFIAFNNDYYTLDFALFCFVFN